MDNNEKLKYRFIIDWQIINQTPNKSYYFYYRLLIDLYGNIGFSFYCKNGYTKTEMLKMKHDEGIIIYDFHKFEKNINNY